MFLPLNNCHYLSLPNTDSKSNKMDKILKIKMNNFQCQLSGAEKTFNIFFIIHLFRPMSKKMN